MKRILLTLVLVLVACDGDRPASKNLTLADVKDSWVVVNYWAKWCKPCIKEIPELNLLAERHPEVVVFGVNYDGVNGEELQQDAESLGIRFRLLQEDPSAELGIPRPVVLPTTLILEPGGTVIRTLVGPQTLESLAGTIGQQGSNR